MININPALSTNHLNYLQSFDTYNHLILDNRWSFSIEDEHRENANLPKGKYGEFIVGAPQVPINILKNLECHPNVPSNYCPFVIGKTAIGECSHHNQKEPEIFIQWMNYIIHTFMIRWFYKLHGVLRFHIGYQEYNLIVERNHHVLLEKVYIKSTSNTIWTDSIGYWRTNTNTNNTTFF